MDPEAPSRSKIAERRRKIKAGFLQGKREQGTDESPDDLANTPTSQDAPQRIVHINDPKTTNESYEYAGNQVRTSKYTLISFLPRNLFEQFHRVAYLYFLAIVILNQIPQLAVFGRTASVFPLVFVLLVTAIKDTYEDWGRRKSDVKENNRLCLVMQDDHFAPKKWKHIQVGDIVKVCEDETIPCDLVLLATSDSNGLAYVQTINLDGESNLKTRYAKQETIARHPELGSFVGRLECETPNRNIYEFTAFVDLDGVTVPLGPNNIILRGCELKNTPWVVGVVVYAGQETKAMLNSSGAQSKRSRLEKQMNREIAWLAAFLITMSVVGGLGLGLWIGRHEDELNVIPYYVKTDYSTGKTYQYSGRVGEAIFGFLSCIIVFQIMVPISLYISMELVRLGQCYFMTQDLDMYYGPSNTHFQARALTINEDLGQIKYLFSDKTGTLTENRMEFQTSSIYGVDYADARIHSDTVVVTEGAVEPGDSGDAQGPLVNQAWRPKVGAKLDPRLVHILQGPDNTIEWRAAHDFLLALAACNTVVPTSLRATSGEQTEVDVESAGAIRYQAESPDEQALVVAAAAYGFILLERTSEYLVINVLGNTQRFDVLGVHEFDSTRKCMSVVLKCPDGTLQGFVKGADTAVLDRIASVSNKAPSASTSKQFDEVLAATLAHLDRYAREGLRTLVVASKLLDSSEFETWKSMHEKASISIMNRVGMMRSAAEVVESNLVLLGATGIEDRLQEGVPETIAALREAGIKIWVLTGDKQETAISIGFSCLLLTRDMHQIIINATTKDGCREALRQAKVTYRVQLQKIQTQENADPGKPTTGPGSWTNQNGGLDNHSDQQETRDSQTGGNAPLALIIDGNSLVYALSEDLEDELLDLAMSCKVVVCCRVAPLQKAGLVSLVKRKTKEMTLAVGDGANDVSMIQMADVGVGISGQEGRQAVMASDFALGQFKYLKKLLLVHGHWNYQRLGYMVLYNFYRNAVFVTMLFWYIIYTAFSPISALSDWNLVFYSFIYTSVPTIVVGILDKDIVSTTLLAYPALYGSGHREEAYNKLLFWATILDTLWQSLVLFFVPFFTYQSSTMDTFSIGDLWTISVVVVVNVNLALNIRTWTWIHHVAVWGSIVATFISLLVMDAIKVEGVFRYHWAIFHLASTAEFWLDIILLVVLALLPQFFIQAVKQRFRPSDIDIAREFEIEVRSRNVTERPSVELHEVRHSPNPER